MNDVNHLSFSALYRVAEIRQIEAAAKVTLAPGSLMLAAGSAAADFVKCILCSSNRKILVLVGPGDNGGDALVAAQFLAAAGLNVTVILCVANSRYSKEAQQSLLAAEASSVSFIDLAHFLNDEQKNWDLIIDGIFGIGLTRPITDEIAELIVEVNQKSQKYHIPVLALDVPSGLNADTGQIIGESEIAVRANYTLTFIANKPGLYTATGKDYSGHIVLADLNISSDCWPTPCAFLSHPSMFSQLLKPRLNDTHKGSFGDVQIIGGSDGMHGAALLAARSAIHCGAGRVYVGFIGTPPMLDSPFPELMCRHANELEFGKSVVIIGPGLGQTNDAKQILAKAIDNAKILVVDADALNLIAKEIPLQKLLVARYEKNLSTILTPHPLEAARLLNVNTTEIQADRLQSTQSLINKFNCSVILKGAGTVVGTFNGNSYINTTGNAALATAGTGDVLTGVCGALLAQHVSVSEAATFAVWLHGLAADQLVAAGIGPIGLTASELIPAIRSCLNKFIIDANNGMLHGEFKNRSVPSYIIETKRTADDFA